MYIFSEKFSPQKLVTMKKILGLDLGTNSIGWAVVNEAEKANEESSIVKLGVRVIHYDNYTNAEGSELKGDAGTFFIQGKSVTPNASRTQSRGMRRNLQRYKLRRENLIEILKENSIITNDSVLTEEGNRTTFETYRLRAKAVTEEITLEQLARVLLQINKKRGYKSSRKAKSEGEGQAVDGMDVARYLYDNDLTPGQYMLEIAKSGKRTKIDFYRSDLQSEFDKVWEAQKKFYLEILTDELKENLKEKNRTQTWAICKDPFNIVGIKRTTKGQEQRIETLQWRSDALTKQIGLEKLAIVLQEINGQISNSSGYLGAISDRSKELFFTHQTVGQYKMAELAEDSNRSLKNQVFYRQDYLDEFETIWETQAKFHKELTPDLKKDIRDCVIFYQRKLKSQKGLINICELEGKEIEIEVEGKKKKKIIGPKVCPKSSPVYQDFRIWQRLNDITISGRPLGKEERTLFSDLATEADDERMELFTELSIRKDLNKKDALRLLYGSNSKTLDMNFDKLEGNRTQAALFEAYRQIVEQSGHGEYDFSKMTAAEIIKMVTEVFDTIGINTDILTFDPCADDFECQPMYQLWHLLYSYEGDNSKSGNDKLITKLQEEFGFAPEYGKIVANVMFEQDYGRLSTKAIRKLLPYMQGGNQYSEACVYAGYNHSKRSLTKEQIANKVLKDQLDLLPRNSLRNPMVEKILNQMVNVVNEIVRVYGKPDEIRIELARELKKSQQERKDASEIIGKNTKEQAEYKKILETEFGISHVTKNDIIRYRLYKELEGNGYHTLYSNTYIPKEEIFSKKFDIEHIIPQAKLFDDSFSNKTLEARSVNIDKGSTTAYDYVKTTYGNNQENSLENYKNRVDKLFADGKISKAKHEKLLMEEKDIPSGFIDRELRDSQYIAKKARGILEEVVRIVTPTVGSITARLREDWQIVDVMKELNLPKYRKLGMTHYDQDNDGRQIERINDGWTKRNDHRHHAMDALTIAFTQKSIIQYLNNLNARIGKSLDDKIDLSRFNFNDIKPEDRTAVEYAIEKKKLKRNDKGKLVFIEPMPNFRAKAKEQLENILISVKAGSKVATRNVNKIKGSKNGNQVTLTPRGQMHNETIYGSIKRYEVNMEKVGSNFNTDKIATVANKKYREALKKRLEEYGNDAKKAFTGKNSIEKNPIWLNEEHSYCVPPKVKTVVMTTIFTIRKGITPDLKTDKVIDVKVKKILEERLKEYGNDPKKAFSNFDENPIWLNKEKGIAIKRVTITGVSNAIALHSKHDQYGKLILNSDSNEQPADFVSTGNNHHVAIYRDDDGNLQDKVVSFYEAVERKRQGLEIIDKSYNGSKGWKFLFSMKQNEYFVFPNAETGFDPNEIDLTDPKNNSRISPNLFRVQKFSRQDYVFRHHLETQINDVKDLKNIAYKRIGSLKFLERIVKVRVNHIGQIVSVGEE